MNILSKFKLENKVAIITGGARGLGKSMAIGLAEAGADIVIADLNIEMAEETVKDIKRIGVKALAIETDVTNEDSVKALIKKTIDELGSLDILINNAGIAKHAPAEKMKIEDWNSIIDVNLNGVFLCAKEAARIMIKQNEGTIINIASMSSYIVNHPQCQSAYNASKSGVLHLTKSLAAEWADNNIRVNGIAPGYMMTEMTKEFVEDNKEMVEKFWINPTPMKRIGQPEELRGAAVFLASDASSFMTGHTIVIDGGYLVY